VKAFDFHINFVIGAIIRQKKSQGNGEIAPIYLKLECHGV